MPPNSENAVRTDLEKRGFAAVSIKRQENGRAEVDAVKLHPLPVAGEEPIYVEVPVSLSVSLDKQGHVQSVKGDTPNEAAVADALRQLKTLRDNKQVAEPATAGGPLPPGVTHEIVRDTQGRRVLRRRRFSLM